MRDIRSHTDVEQVLDELGTPQEIAQAAYAELPVRPQVSGRDAFTVIAVLLGGFVFLVGWVVGVILLWTSNTWSTKDKVVATLLVPGGLAASLLFGGAAALTSVTTCSGDHCTTTAGAGQGAVVFTWVVLAVAVIGPLYTAAMLIHAARRAR